jgi:L-ascorbate metabolism protein UlaG (beta-lactamase superfamily)
MRLQWVGQCCFHITAADGRSVLIDPYQRVIGLERGDFPADLVLFSHSHIDHCDPSAAPVGAAVVSTPGHHEAAGFRVMGWKAFHDNREGLLSGEVVLFGLEVDGFKILHLSDLGESLDEQRLRAFGRPDILLFPAGEHTTITLEESAELVRQLAPRIAIPMSFHLPGLLMPAAQPSRVERAFPRHRRAHVVDLACGQRLEPTTDIRILDAVPYSAVQPALASVSGGAL